MSTHYVPGPGVGLIGDAGWVLLDVDSDAPLVTEIWSVMQNGGGLGEMLLALTVAGFSDLPSFALATRESANWHLLVRGAARIEVADESGCREVMGTGLRSWTEVVIDGDLPALRLILPSPENDVAPLPAGRGVVLARDISVRPGGQVPAAELPLRDTSPALTQVSVVADVAVEPEALLDITLNEAPDAPGTEEDSGVPTETPPSYDDFFAPPPTTRADASTPARKPIDELPVVEAPLNAAPEAPPQADRIARQAPAPGSGLIETVPIAAGAEVPHAAPLSARPDGTGPAEAQDEPTRKRTDIQALARELKESADRLAPKVHAVACAQGHLNDPQGSVCRLCAAPLADQEPVTVPRPVLGLLRLSTGDSVQLDRDVLIGRNPTSDKQGSRRPHLVKVPSPDSDISRNHVLIELDGWHVLVRDLKTTNGTMVRPLGGEPVRLRADDPLPIQPGASIVLSDAVSLVYEPEA